MAYIDKELFKQDIKMRYCNNCARPSEIKCRACHIDDMLGEIEDAPTADVVEVVRCKDCKYCSHHYSIPLEEDIYQCRFEFGDDYPVPMVEATFYCGRGERKEGASVENW